MLPCSSLSQHSRHLSCQSTELMVPNNLHGETANSSKHRDGLQLVHVKVEAPDISSSVPAVPDLEREWISTVLNNYFPAENSDINKAPDIIAGDSSSGLTGNDRKPDMSEGGEWSIKNSSPGRKRSLPISHVTSAPQQARVSSGVKKQQEQQQTTEFSSNGTANRMGQQLPAKKKRNLPGTPDPDAQIVALSPKTLLATNRYFCEICHKGFQRDQNLQLHRRGHKLPWKLKQRTTDDSNRKRVYICPEMTCVHHDPSRALGDLTGIKKHFCRKHGEKRWKCDNCSKRYAVQSDCKVHMKLCGTREYRCDCGTLFSRKNSFTTHKAYCETLDGNNVKVPVQRQMDDENLVSFSFIDDGRHGGYLSIIEAASTPPRLNSQIDGPSSSHAFCSALPHLRTSNNFPLWDLSKDGVASIHTGWTERVSKELYPTLSLCLGTGPRFALEPTEPKMHNTLKGLSMVGDGGNTCLTYSRMIKKETSLPPRGILPQLSLLDQNHDSVFLSLNSFTTCSQGGEATRELSFSTSCASNSSSSSSNVEKKSLINQYSHGACPQTSFGFMLSKASERSDNAKLALDLDIGLPETNFMHSISLHLNPTRKRTLNINEGLNEMEFYDNSCFSLGQGTSSEVQGMQESLCFSDKDDHHMFYNGAKNLLGYTMRHGNMKTILLPSESQSYQLFGYNRENFCSNLIYKDPHCSNYASSSFPTTGGVPDEGDKHPTIDFLGVGVTELSGMMQSTSPKEFVSNFAQGYI